MSCPRRSVVAALIGFAAAGCDTEAPAHPSTTSTISEICVDCAPTVRRYAVLGGRGPGVGGNIVRILAVGDSLHVFDSDLARQTVLRRDGSVVRTRPLTPGIRAAAVLQNGCVFAYAVCGYGCEAYPFHVFADTGRLVSFGGSGETDLSLRARWSAVAADGNSAWTARASSYRLYRWSETGEPIDSIIRDVPWFSDHETPPYRHGLRPRPKIGDIHLDERRRLWILIHVADDRWADQFRDAPSPDMRFNGDMESYWDTFLEVIDLGSRRVLASARYDEYIPRFTSRGELVAERQAINGEPYLEIWHLRLR
jgi:hypothetical protein